METVKKFVNPLSPEEEKRLDFLSAAKLKNEKQHDQILREMRQLIYKIENTRMNG